MSTRVGIWWSITSKIWLYYVVVKEQSKIVLNFCKVPTRLLFNFELLLPKVKVHMHQLFRSLTVWKSLNAIPTEAVSCSRLYSISFQGNKKGLAGKTRALCILPDGNKWHLHYF